VRDKQQQAKSNSKKKKKKTEVTVCLTTPNGILDMSFTFMEHADLLATKWWTGEEFIAQGEYNSIRRRPTDSYIRGVLHQNNF